MKPARILLLVVALAAGGLAAFFATRGEGPGTGEAAVRVEAEPKTQVLVAAASIGIGTRLSEKYISWQDWPKSALRPEYITSETVPDALERMTGTVARYEIFIGEPIRMARLATSESGYLSAVIAPGMRAVSVPVTAESAAGGFIVPNDKVDVILTRRGNIVAETILANVRIMAIGQDLGGAVAGDEANKDEEGGNAAFSQPTIATLELTPSQAETIVNAQANGKLALSLRSVADFAGAGADFSRSGGASISLIRFGRQSSVLSGAKLGGEELGPAQISGTSSIPTLPVSALVPSVTPPSIGVLGLPGASGGSAPSEPVAIR
jgi:pilus assembly protein CpaB